MMFMFFFFFFGVVNWDFFLFFSGQDFFAGGAHCSGRFIEQLN